VLSTETQEMMKKDLFRAIRTEAEREGIAFPAAPAALDSAAAAPAASPAAEKVTLF